MLAVQAGRRSIVGWTAGCTTDSEDGIVQPLASSDYSLLHLPQQTGYLQRVLPGLVGLGVHYTVSPSHSAYLVLT